jgi:hypothetical protein
VHLPLLLKMIVENGSQERISMSIETGDESDLDATRSRAAVGLPVSCALSGSPWTVLGNRNAGCC